MKWIRRWYCLLLLVKDGECASFEHQIYLNARMLEWKVEVKNLPDCEEMCKLWHTKKMAAAHHFWFVLEERDPSEWSDKWMIFQTPLSEPTPKMFILHQYNAPSLTRVNKATLSTLGCSWMSTIVIIYQEGLYVVADTKHAVVAMILISLEFISH